jgi:hypothetical protein
VGIKKSHARKLTVKAATGASNGRHEQDSLIERPIHIRKSRVMNSAIKFGWSSVELQPKRVQVRLELQTKIVP